MAIVESVNNRSANWANPPDFGSFLNENIQKENEQAQAQGGSKRDIKLYSENDVVANTLLVTDVTKWEDYWKGMFKGYTKRIVQAALKENPNMRILVVDNADHLKISQMTGAPEKNIIAVPRYGGVDFPQDGFLAGPEGIFEPEPLGRYVQAPNEGLVSGQFMFTPAFHLAGLLSDELKIKKNGLQLPFIGGDVQFLTMPDGRQMCYFGYQTINYVAEIMKANNRLLPLAKIFQNLRDKGIGINNIMPVGIGSTYSEELAKLTPDEKKLIPDDILKRFNEMKNLPMPLAGPSYHTDLVLNSLDGVNFFINKDDADEDQSVTKILEFFGKNPHTLPAKDMPQIGRLTYVNWVMGVKLNGKKFILLPTEAEDPENLTNNDQKAVEVLKKVYGDIDITPIGARSAILKSNRNWGPHCFTQILPWQFNSEGKLIKQ